MNVYRVTVRGEFKGLSPRAKSWLAASADQHDLFLSSFTEEGTLTYDAQLRAFNLRYEVRLAPDSGPEGGPKPGPKADLENETATGDPAAVALKEAELFLRTMGLAHGPLRSAVMDMNAMTAKSERRSASQPIG